MTFTEQNKKTIQEAFDNFHQANPMIYKLIVREAKELIRKGRKRFSVKQIAGAIRWDTYLVTTENTLFGSLDVNKRFKIGDQYTSRYSRLLVEQYPEMAGYIEMREIRSV